MVFGSLNLIMKSKNQRVGAIVQARITSKRLPKKVLANISGKPMLERVVDRLKAARKIDEIIIAIPDTKENNELEGFIRKNDFKYFKGSEDDVLSRYYQTAKSFKCDVIVRFTADCPLIDPKIVDLIIEKYLSSDADYASNVIKRTFPRGLDTEVFNFEVLEKAHKEAKERYQREHVTP